MKKVLKLVLGLAMLLPFAAYAQTTAVTATLTDPSSVTWIAGTCTAAWTGTGTPSTTTGQSVNTKPTCTVNSSGVMSVTVTDVAFIQPPSASWQFCATPGPVAPTAQYCVVVAATGASQNISAQIQAVLVAPSITGGPLAKAYADSEVTAVNGNQYYSLTAGQFRCYAAGAWVGCAQAGGGFAGYPGVTTDGANGLTISGNSAENSATIASSFALGSGGFANCYGGVAIANQLCTPTSGFNVTGELRMQPNNALNIKGLFGGNCDITGDTVFASDLYAYGGNPASLQNLFRINCGGSLYWGSGILATAEGQSWQAWEGAGRTVFDSTKLGHVTALGTSGFSGTGTVFLSTFNNGGSAATDTVNLVSGSFSSDVPTNAGSGLTALPTTATCTNGTASCPVNGGTVNVTTTGLHVGTMYHNEDTLFTGNWFAFGMANGTGGELTPLAQGDFRTGVNSRFLLSPINGTGTNVSFTDDSGNSNPANLTAQSFTFNGPIVMNNPATLASGTTATTRPLGTNDTTVATMAAVQAAVPKTIFTVKSNTQSGYTGTGPVGCQDCTTATQIFSVPIPANTFSATGSGHMDFDLFLGPCLGSAYPYSFCSASNTGTCAWTIYIANSATGTDINLLNSGATTAGKSGIMRGTMYDQNSLSSWVIETVTQVNTTQLPNNHSLQTESLGSTLYINGFVQSASGGANDGCGITAANAVYYPQ